MTYQVIIEAPAQADMEEVYRRLAADSPEQAAQRKRGIGELRLTTITLSSLA